MNRTGWNSYMPSDSSTPPRLSNFSQLIRAFLASVGGYTTCRANITFSQRRAFRCHRFSILWFLSLTPHSVSTLRSAIELKAVFDQIQQAEQSGTLSAEEKKRLEEQAAEKGLQALFKVRLSSHRISAFSVPPMLTYAVKLK